MKLITANKELNEFVAQILFQFLRDKSKKDNTDLVHKIIGTENSRQYYVS